MKSAAFGWNRNLGRTFTFLAVILLAPILGMSENKLDSTYDYRLYHEQTIISEQLVVEERFEEALEHYEQLFDTYPFIYRKEYSIAAQLAFLTNQKQKAVQYIQRGILAGWEFKSIRQNKILAPLSRNFDKEAYKIQRQAYLDGVDASTRTIAQQMFKKDQKMAFRALLRFGDRAQETYSMKKFAPHSENQMQQLILQLNTKGYPGEQKIGNDYWISTIISHHNSISSAYAKQDTLYTHIRPKLNLALRKGEISPYEFALIDDWYRTVLFEKSVPGYGYLNAPKAQTIIETNRLRGLIGLRNIELRNQLIELEQKTGMCFYLPDWVWQNKGR